MKEIDSKYLAVPLPEGVEEKKYRGDFDGARETIAAYLSKEIPKALKNRLLLEQDCLQLLEEEYALTWEQVLAEMKSYIPDFTEEELLQLDCGGRLDWIWLSGRKMYLLWLCRSLIKSEPELAARAGALPEKQLALRQEAARRMKEEGSLSCLIHIRQWLRVKPSEAEPGKILRVHLPIPVELPPTSDLKLLDFQPQPKHIGEGNALQRTVYFEEEAREGKEDCDNCFSVEYACRVTMPFSDLAGEVKKRLRAGEEGAAVHWSRQYPPELEPYLEEQLPHIRFSPFLRELAAELAGQEKDPLVVAKRFYDYITGEIQYAYVREYAGFHSIAEYCALNGSGDCGVQALLFITLCRIAEIPAAWQSGLGAEPGSVGNHDWARFYTDSFGWRWVDCSFGGAARRFGREELRDFYFGNLDPYRIIYNNGIQQEFTPPKVFRRADPYDNQSGEAEYETRGLSFSHFDCEKEEVEIRLL